MSQNDCEKNDRIKKPEDNHDLNNKIPNHAKIFTSLIAGAVAGAVAKTTIAPLDRAKINFQARNMSFSAIQCLRFLSVSVRKEGVLSLWRGNSATMARILPYAAVQYASHEQFKHLLNFNSKELYLSPGRRYIAGALAGVTSVSCTYPLDMVRARMAVTGRDKYHTLFEAFWRIVREEGWRTIYRGFTPTLLGVIPYAGTSFYTYETLKKQLTERTSHHTISPMQMLACGAVAGLCGQSMSYPLDIIRRRMQTAGVTGHSQDYQSIVHTAKLVIHEEGIIHGLYKGLSLNWIKGPIAVGISFMTFDITQRNLRKLKMFHLKET